jgi:hypothetical protein
MLRNLSALSGVAYEKLGAIFPSLIAPTPAPTRATDVRKRSSKGAQVNYKIHSEPPARNATAPSSYSGWSVQIRPPQPHVLSKSREQELSGSTAWPTRTAVCSPRDPLDSWYKVKVSVSAQDRNRILPAQAVSQLPNPQPEQHDAILSDFNSNGENLSRRKVEGGRWPRFL